MKFTALKHFASALTLLALIGSATAFAQQNNKPNVVFILADNVGYGDLGILWRRRVARGSDATPRCTGSRRIASHPIPRGASVHSLPYGTNDRAIFDPQRSVVDRH